VILVDLQQLIGPVRSSLTNLLVFFLVLGRKLSHFLLELGELKVLGVVGCLERGFLFGGLTGKSLHCF
jgi:hypothetical protein